MIVRVASPTHDLRVSGSSILDELTWRGLVAQTTDRDALAADIAKGPISVYEGSTLLPRVCTPGTWCRCSP